DQRDARDLVTRRQPWRLVDVDLGEHHLAAPLPDELFEHWPQRVARPAPGGPEIDHDRHLLRALHHLALEVGFVNVYDPGGFRRTHAGPPRQSSGHVKCSSTFYRIRGKMA